MNAVTQFARNGKEVDISKSVQATIEALPAGAIFSVSDIVDVLSSANPNDEDCSDVEFLEGSVSRLVSRTFSNRMSPASLFLCEEDGTGAYIRYGREQGVIGDDLSPEMQAAIAQVVKREQGK